MTATYTITTLASLERWDKNKPEIKNNHNNEPGQHFKETFNENLVKSSLKYGHLKITYTLVLSKHDILVNIVPIEAIQVISNYFRQQNKATGPLKIFACYTHKDTKRKYT